MVELRLGCASGNAQDVHLVFRAAQQQQKVVATNHLVLDQVNGKKQVTETFCTMPIVSLYLPSCKISQHGAVFFLLNPIRPLNHRDGH